MIKFFGNQEELDRKVLVISFFLSRRSLVEKTVFDLRLVNVRFVMNNVEKWKTSLPALRFPVAVLFYQRFVLIFIHMLTLPKGQNQLFFGSRKALDSLKSSVADLKAQIYSRFAKRRQSYLFLYLSALQ